MLAVGLRFWVGLVLLLAPPAFAVVVPLTLDRLSDQSDVIVHGTVADREGRRETQGPEIYTIVTVNVSKLVFSRRDRTKPLKSITFRLEGGTVDGESMVTSISPELEKGDEGVFFLAYQAGEDVLMLVGASQGFVPVEGGMVTVEGREQPLREFLDDLSRRLQ